MDLEYFAEGRGKPDWMKHADELLISKIELLKKDCHSDDPIIRQAAQHFLNLLEKQQLKISEILEKAPQHVTRKEKYASIVPLMDAPVYRKWLLNQYETLSGKKVEINSVITLEPDSTEFKELCKNFDVIINCAGEQARNLSQTAKTFPVRGLVGVAEIPSQLTYSIGVEPDPSLDNGNIIISYAIKRGERDVVIGGTYEVLENAPSSPPLSGEEKRKHDLQNIKENIFPLVPGLKSAEELKVHEVREGFRSGSQSMEASLSLIKTESGEKALGAAFGYGGGGYSVAHGVGKEMLVLCNNLSFKLREAISSPPQLKGNTPS